MATTFLNPYPQPGDGAWLLQHKYGIHNRGRKVVPSFLRQNARVGDELEAGNRGPKHHETFLQDDGQERTSFAHAHDSDFDNVPRTIRNDALLSYGANIRNLHQAQNTHLLRDSVEPTYTFSNSAFNHLPSRSADNAMALPPHLRPKKAPSHLNTMEEANVIADVPALTNGEDNTAYEAPPDIKSDEHHETPIPPLNKLPIVDVRKLANARSGAEVRDAKPAAPALVPYPSSNEGEKHATNGIFKAAVADPMNRGSKHPIAKSSSGDRAKKSDSEHRSKRGGAQTRRGRGRGGFNGASNRASQWPTTAEVRADRHRWDIKWDSSTANGSDIDSACADSGFGNGNKKKRVEGVDEETGFLLTDWSGKWAPAPVDWDARPAFKGSQSAPQIDRWMIQIDEEMCGKDWTIAIEDLNPADSGAFSVCSSSKVFEAREVAPRYWIPLVIGKQAPQTFWNEVVKSTTPKPFDEGDLDSVKPWWESYQIPGGVILNPCKHPQIKGIDPDENEAERIARENDYGSNQHTENRKRTEKAKRDAQRDRRKRAQEKARKISESSPMAQSPKIQPKINLYIRPARHTDVPDLRKIYNHYVSHTVCTPELEQRANPDMHQRYADVLANKLPFLVACERGGRIKGRGRKKNEGEDMVLPDKVVGFASADDYNDMRGMYRFTAEIEVYIDDSYYMKGVAKCLVDKLMGLLDPVYVERGGYDIVGEELKGVGPSRIIQNIVVNLPYDNPTRLEWTGRWLTNWYGFKQVGDLQGIGNKDGKSVNLAILQRTTGANVDASKPPITMEYPS